MAQQLQQVMEEGRGNRTGARVRSPFRTELEESDEQPTFYAPPHRPPVVKVENDADPLVFGDSR